MAKVTMTEVVGGVTVTSTAVTVSVVSGTQGPQGPQGPAGPTGATGATGATGPAGADGSDGQGVPTGGTSGQVLAKASATDFDTEWVDQTGGTGGSVTSDDITDATTVGKAVLTATDAAAARTAIGAGTSSLAIGTTSTTALAGDTAIPSTPADIGAATAAQGALADSATQPGDLGTAAAADTGDFDAAGAATTAQTNAEAYADTGDALKLAKASNLSDLANAATARTNLGLGTSATHASTDYATAAQGTDARTPTAHASTHAAGGSDPVALDASQVTRTTNAQTGTTYTLVLTDATKFISLTNSSAITLTVPPNSSVAFPVGTEIILAQLGAGQVTIAAGSGVTVNSSPGLKVAAQYGTAALKKTATDTWLAFGRLSA